MNSDNLNKTEAPIADRLSKRTLAPPTPSLLDAPLPTPASAQQGPEQAGPRPAPRTGVAPAPAMPRDAPDLSLGTFFAQNKAVVDERRHHLARLGMMTGHVDALRMPDLEETPRPPAVLAENLPPVNQADGKAEAHKAPAMPEGEVQ